MTDATDTTTPVKTATRSKDELTPLIHDHHNDFNGGGTFSTPSRAERDDSDVEEGGGLLRRLSSRNRRRRQQQQQQNDNDDNNNDEPAPFRHRRDSSLLDVALEQLQDFQEVLVEKIEEVQEVIVENVDHIQEVIVEGMEEIKEVMDEPVSIPVAPRPDGDHSQKLSALACAVLVFYKVSGGPFGCEPAVKAAGPFYALLGFALFPILWCLPEALVTAELGSAFPEPSGSVAWVEEAFGPQVSLLCGYFHWISGATDNAIYPSLFLRYVASYFADDSDDNTITDVDLEHQMTRFAFVILITTVLAAINYSGLELVGNLSIVVCIISMSPFIVMTILALPKLDVRRWMILPEANVDMGADSDDGGVGLLPNPMMGGVLWRPLLNSLFWNLNSFDVGASFAGEIHDPQKVFPRAMFLSVLFVVLSYLVPLLAALGATDTRQEDWDAGYFTVVANDIGGPWLAAWTVFAAAISNIALFEAEMSGDAYQLMGMADRGLIPKLFAKRSRFGTPTNGILLGTFVIFALSVADFDQLVEMLNFAYSMSLMMEFAAFVKLRITDDEVERPYRIPLNTVGCIMFVTPPTIFLVYLMLIASMQTYIYLLILLICGGVIYLLQKLSKHYHWAEYVEAPKRPKVKAGTTVSSIASGGNQSGGSSPTQSVPSVS